MEPALQRVGGRAQPHVLVLPFPFLSHMDPLLSVSHLLASAHGFRISFLTTHHRFLQLTSPSPRHPFHPSIHFHALPATAHISAADHEGLNAPKTLLQAFHSIRESGALDLWLQEFHEKKGHPLTCIISDTLLSWTQPLADKLGIPRAAFWASTAISYALYGHASLFARHEGDEVREGDLAMPLKVPGINNGVPTSVLPIQKVLQGSLPFIEMDKNCTWLMINTSNHIDNEALQSIEVSLPNTKVLDIFPCILSLDANSCIDQLNNSITYSTTIFKSTENVSCMDWLDSKPTSSVIYISFGSIVSLEREKIQEIALALENSKKNFLWVLRSTKNDIPNYKCIKDGSILPKGFVERTNEQGFILSWAPQHQVLAHPSVGCFLTHCGWSSTLESLSCGVPLLGIPLLDFADLNIIGWYIEHVWQVGLHLPIEDVNKVEVEKALEALMGENNGTTNFYHENAIRIGEAFKFTTLQEELNLFSQEVIKLAHSIVDKCQGS